MSKSVWEVFAEFEGLTAEQLASFNRYSDLLLEHNKNYNLTAITSQDEVIKYHFRDSLAIREYIDFSKISAFADVGCGAGFPSIPLKIVFPHIPVLLLEVNKKKQSFLRTVSEELGLADVEIADLDWRTFLRTTQGEIPLFLSRASLPTDELIRIFKPSCAYNTATVVYWASSIWQADKKTEPYVMQVPEYKIAYKKRKFVFLSQQGMLQK